MGCGGSKKKKHTRPTIYMADPTTSDEADKAGTTNTQKVQAATEAKDAGAVKSVKSAKGAKSAKSTTSKSKKGTDSAKDPDVSQKGLKVDTASTKLAGPVIEQTPSVAGGGGGAASAAGLPDNDFQEPESARPDLRTSLRDAGDRLVTILFYEDECEDCEAMRMLYEEFVIAYPDILFLEANVRTNKETVESLNLKFLPTFICFRNHLEVGRLVSTDAADLEQMLQSNTIYIPPYVEPEMDDDEPGPGDAK